MIRAEALALGRLFSRFLILLAALLAVLAMICDAAAAGTPEPVPAETMLAQGGLFLPSDRPGYVIPATTVDSDVVIDVNGLVARARITQRFVNPTAHWVEGVYVFPLPENSAVDRLDMRIGERVVEGVIQEKEQAQRTYRLAAQAGQVASLVSQQRPNIFTTAVANIAPDDSITVSIEYQQTLAYDGADGAFSLRFPMVVLPRYIPGTPIETDTGADGTGWSADTDRVPDASRITPPVAAPGSGPVNPVRLTVTLNPGFPLAAVESPYHGIAVDDHGDGSFTVTLAEGQVWADRDFELVWRPAPSAAPTVGLFSERVGEAEYHLMLVMPPMADAAAETAADMPREIVFVIDTSGSMAGDSILQARQALLDALGRLGPGDRFNVIAFDDAPDALFASAKPAVEGTMRRARTFVEGLVADGGTEMRRALELALDGTAEEGAIRQVVFITDGSVGNEGELFGVIHRLLGDTRLFTVGIGSAPNSHFMREAAQIGRGTFTYIGATSEVGETMAALFARLDRPALTDIAIAWPDGGEAAEAYPAKVPDLYLGEPVVVSVRLPEGNDGDVLIDGSAAGAHWDRTVTLDRGREAPGVATLWARAKIAELERDRYRGAAAQATREQILEVALAHRLVSRFTSLVAVDEEVVRPPEADLTTEAVATNMPDGVEMRMAGPQEPARATPVRDAALSGPHPSSVAAIRSMAETGSPVRVAQLPSTATPATANLMFGAILLLAAALLMWIAAQRRRFA